MIPYTMSFDDRIAAHERERSDAMQRRCSMPVTDNERRVYAQAKQKGFKVRECGRCDGPAVRSRQNAEMVKCLRCGGRSGLVAAGGTFRGYPAPIVISVRIKATCVVCAKEFMATRAGAKTCSPRCRTRLSRRGDNGASATLRRAA
jgi:hypothetical protein